MKGIMCKEVSGLECKFEAKGNTKEDVKKSLEKHAMEKHGDMLRKMSEGDKKKMGQKMDKALEHCGC